jgi:hypothetical protein
MPPFVSKLSPEQWAEVRRLRAEGASYKALSARFGVTAAAIGKRARKEVWAAPGSAPAAGGGATSGAGRKPKRRPSPATADTRRRLARHLYSITESRIRMVKTAMKKKLKTVQGNPNAGPLAYTPEERETFAALIEDIHKVTEIASEPASAAAGGRKSINPELTALSDELDAAGLAAASEKDDRTTQLAEQLAKAVGPA